MWQVYLIRKIVICLDKLWKTTHNVKHGSSVRMKTIGIPHVSFIQWIKNCLPNVGQITLGSNYTKHYLGVGHA